MKFDTLSHNKAIFIVSLLLGARFIFSFLLPDSPKFFPYLIVEIAILTVINIFTRSILTKSLLFACVVIESMQLANLHSTGNYIDPLTILNIQEYHVVGKDLLIKTSSTILAFIALALPEFILHIKNKPKLNAYLSLAVLALFVTFETENFPVKNFAQASSKVHEIYTFKPSGQNAQLFASTHVNSRKFPLDNTKKYNIVVVFMEGTSYSVLNDSLTPNMEYLKNSSLNVINYYNHTAATFRGLRGQLVSGYQLRGGRGNIDMGIFALPTYVINKTFTGRLESLPTILNNNGYNTVFLSPHIGGGENNALNSFIKSTGFNQIFIASDYEKYHGSMLTDKEMYRFLWDKMQELSNFSQPFFLCVYTVGTHHGMDSLDATFWGDGKNEYLNKFHNHDIWFGEFFSKFVSNKELYEKTIFILTSDHATYSTPLFRETFSLSNPFFVDSIPFIIHYKGISPAVLDAKYKNSLSFAPTVLDLTPIETADTHFLGDSLFSEHGQSPFAHISSIGFDFFVTDEQGVRPISQEDEQYRGTIELIRKFFDYGG